MVETEAIPSPKIFRLWSAITAISGVLERKTYTRGSAGEIYPNMFTLLVGPPASGKTNAIKAVRPLWSKIEKLYLAPDNVTKASLIEALARALRTEMNDNNTITTFSALNVSCSEFGVFFVHHDTEFLSVLNHIYDGPPIYLEERITAGTREVIKPHLVILAGTQPDFLSSFMPEEAWGMGFASRLMMVYSDQVPTVDLFAQGDKVESKLGPPLRQIFSLKGEFLWTEEARNELNAWNKAGCPPVPKHSKLLHYNGRRALHTIKLSMISAASRAASLTVTLEDLERAQEWILEAEKVMPDIFRAMSQKSDANLIKDLHYHIYQIYSAVTRDKRKPIPTSVLWQYLEDKVPSERIARIIETAEQTGAIKKGPYPDEWVPRPLMEMSKS